MPRAKHLSFQQLALYNHPSEWSTLTDTIRQEAGFCRSRPPKLSSQWSLWMILCPSPSLRFESVSVFCSILRVTAIHQAKAMTTSFPCWLRMRRLLLQCRREQRQRQKWEWTPGLQNDVRTNRGEETPRRSAGGDSRRRGSDSDSTTRTCCRRSAWVARWGAARRRTW